MTAWIRARLLKRVFESCEQTRTQMKHQYGHPGALQSLCSWCEVVLLISNSEELIIFTIHNMKNRLSRCSPVPFSRCSAPLGHCSKYPTLPWSTLPHWDSDDVNADIAQRLRVCSNVLHIYIIIPFLSLSEHHILRTKVRPPAIQLRRGVGGILAHCAPDNYTSAGDICTSPTVD